MSRDKIVLPLIQSSYISRLYSFQCNLHVLWVYSMWELLVIVLSIVRNTRGSLFLWTIYQFPKSFQIPKLCYRLSKTSKPSINLLKVKVTKNKHTRQYSGGTRRVTIGVLENNKD